MSQHLHATRVEGCFRCELSRDEPEPVEPEYVICSCCGEPNAPTFPDGEYACGCEWEGCDKDCPVVGHLYDADPEPDPAAARDAAVACDVCDDERWVNREVGYDGVEWGNPCPDCIPESEPVRECGPYCGCNDDKEQTDD